ncbi:MAG: aminodeoxychorismate synthase component I [Rikenellaceae bacterium]
MKRLNRNELIGKINSSASNAISFVFITDFKGEEGYFYTIEDLYKYNIALNIRGLELGKIVSKSNGYTSLTPKPISKNDYLKCFDSVRRHILDGDSYLLNLTIATPLEGEICLSSVYSKANATYKMLFKDKFVFYSPETFVRIKDNAIYSYPMKGTISNSVENAESRLLGDKKELYEHYTIVDLIRNDLALVAKNIEVTKFRYIDRIETSKGIVLQTSSEIKGSLDSDWHSHLGNIIFDMLPAGSISGAPKAKTVSIIEDNELSPRGFYTGVMGYFDGEKFDSSVNIRFINKGDKGNFYYHSGGGITSMSNVDDEYNELITKIYVPIF